VIPLFGFNLFTKRKIESIGRISDINQNSYEGVMFDVLWQGYVYQNENWPTSSTLCKSPNFQNPNNLIKTNAFQFG
jgi:hypothetical protein